MSLPPPGGWPPPQPPGPPPNQGQPYGPSSGFNPQQPPPPGWQQGGWGPPPGPPPPKGSGLKWLLIAVAVLLVIGISVGATLIFTRGDGGGGNTTPTSGAPSDVASANDTGPVSIITDEPTCEAFMGINNNLADIEAKGWSDQRATLGPAAQWTSDQRTQVEAVSTAIKNAANKMVSLAKRTPHRLVRQLYEQAIVYGNSYASSVPSYTAKDNYLADVFVNGSSAIAGMCNAIDTGSASRSLALEPASPPSKPLLPQADTQPEPFIKGSDDTCVTWIDREAQFVGDTSEWEKLDANIPGSAWTPEQRALQLATLPMLAAYADDMESAGRKSGNSALEDFAVAAALYLRAYTSIGAEYVSADSWLYYAAFRLGNTITASCQAAE